MNYGPQGPYFWAFFIPNRAKLCPNSFFFLFSRKFSIGFTQNLILSSLELLLQVCRIWVPGAQWDYMSRTYFEDYWANFHDLKAVKKPVGPSCTLAWLFSLGTPGGLERALGAQILSGVRYMFANTGLIFVLMYGDIQHSWHNILIVLLV